jgi:predicted nucleic acid-binding protein
MIVIDASALLELLLCTPAAARIAARLAPAGETLAAPHLLDLEIAQVLRRYRAGRQIDEARADEALSDYLDLAIDRYPHDILLPRIWELRGTLTAYDAAYVALAEALDAPLLTRDRRLASARGHSAIVEMV